MSAEAIVPISRELLPRPCAHCPWRISNLEQDHPHDFYSLKNLKRLWNGLRTGEAPGMTCHPTDPRMAEFTGYEDTADREKTYECVGSVILLVREITRFQVIVFEIEAEKAAGAVLRSTEALKRYRAAATPRGALTRGTLAEVAWRMAVRSPVVRSINMMSSVLDDPDIGCPFLPAWDPALTARSQRRSDVEE